jgi:hypothetical protein
VQPRNIGRSKKAIRVTSTATGCGVQFVRAAWMATIACVSAS